jgi:hypothetical protein
MTKRHKCIYCLNLVTRVDERDLCAECRDCPPSVLARVTGQATLPFAAHGESVKASA